MVYSLIFRLILDLLIKTIRKPAISSPFNVILYQKQLHSTAPVNFTYKLKQ